MVKIYACKKATSNSIKNIKITKGTAIAAAYTVLKIKIKSTIIMIIITSNERIHRGFTAWNWSITFRPIKSITFIIKTVKFFQLEEQAFGKIIWIGFPLLIKVPWFFIKLPSNLKISLEL